MVFNEILPIPKNLLSKHTSGLIIGKNKTCKTSFLFSFCSSMALKYKDQKVIFICPNFVAKYPLSIDGMPKIDAEASKRIMMFYPKSYEELIDYLAKFYTLNICPSAFVIDDLDVILFKREIQRSTGKSYQQTLSHLMALIVDNIEYLRIAYKQTCELLVATAFNPDSIEDFFTIRTFADHYFEEVYNVNQYLVLEGSGFEIITKDEKFKIRIIVQNDEIKLKDILTYKLTPIIEETNDVKSNEDVNRSDESNQADNEDED